MKDLMKLRSSLCEELCDFGRRDSISMNNLEAIDKLAHSIKNIDKVIEAESMYSGNSYGMSGRGYGGEMYPDEMHSYGRRERDSMGRYSRGDMMSEMRGLVDRTDGRSRQGYERFMGQMENM